MTDKKHPCRVCKKTDIERYPSRVKKHDHICKKCQCTARAVSRKEKRSK